jgi:hypothetical protein
MELSDIIAHCRDRAYMSGADRDKTRVLVTQEVFTPTPLVKIILNELPSEIFADSTQPFIDNSCGDGQFLSEVLIRKIENGIDFETALSTIYGVDLMLDNVKLCRDRLLCGREDLRHIVEKNIVCHNALIYDYSFNGTNFTDKELQDRCTGLEIPNSTVSTKKIKKTITSDLSAFDIE